MRYGHEMNRVKITGVSSPILSRSAPLGQKPEAAPDSVQLSAGVPLAGLVPTAFPVAPCPRLDSQGMTLGQLGGHSAARQELQQLAETLKNGQPAPFSSYLIEGNSGAGKTSLVRALSGELAGLGVTTLHAEAADFSEGGPPKIRQLFAEAQQQASMSPLKTCLVLIDEVEAIAPIRSSFSEAGLQMGTALSAAMASVPGWVGLQSLASPPQNTTLERHQLLTTLTSQMAKNTNVILMATTSRSDLMDKEATGRFERTLECPTPSGPSERLDILKSLAQRRNLQIDEQVLQDMADATVGNNPGDLDKGLRLAQVLGQGQVTDESAREARLQKAFGSARQVTNPDWMLRLTICHEMGHVVVRHLMEEMATGYPDQLPKAIDAVSFAPRGTSNAAVFLKSTTNPASTFEWYMAEVASNLAGRTAESLFGQGHVSAGPGGDIGFATTLAGEAVRQKGMGRNLGPVNPSNDIQHRQANDDEMAINRVGDQIATSTVEFYRDFIDNYAAQMVAKRSDLKQLTVSGRELQDQLRAWQHATPERSQQLTQLKAQIREAIQSIKPLPSPGL
jgi:ATP-dependent Zn protease